MSNINVLSGVAVIGGGPVGCLAGIYLRRRGFNVDIFESRGDMRIDPSASGRSINLVLTSRGFSALHQVGLVSTILKRCIPVYGRNMHSIDGSLTYQAYGPDKTFCNYSISRSELNIALLDAAEQAGCIIHFNHSLDHIDIAKNIMYMYIRHDSVFKKGLKIRRTGSSSASSSSSSSSSSPQQGNDTNTDNIKIPSSGHPYGLAIRAKHIFACDGAGSRARQSLHLYLGSSSAIAGSVTTPLGTTVSAIPLEEQIQSGYKYDIQSAFNITGSYDISIPLRVSYREFILPSLSDGTYAIDPDSLHIWPRGTHFLMALPNLHGSFTLTLYLPDNGNISFNSLQNDHDVLQFFNTYYPDVVPLIPDLLQQWYKHPSGFLGSIQSFPWHYRSNIVLCGDASHAITPFFGQGCNFGMETIEMLFTHIDRAAKTRPVYKIPQGQPITPLFTNQQALSVFGSNLAQAFTTLTASQKTRADAIASMAVENYIEMSSKTAIPHFLAMKQLETAITHKYPDIFKSRYVMVTHTLIPYSVCYVLGEAQYKLLNQIMPNNKDDSSLAQMTPDEIITYIDNNQLDILIKGYQQLLHKFNIDTYALRDVTKEIVTQAIEYNQQQQNIINTKANIAKL